MECVPNRQHMSLMRERKGERERERERARARGVKLTEPERLATTALLLFALEVYLVYLFRQALSLSLSLSLSRWMVPPYHAILPHPLQGPASAPLFFPLTPPTSPLPLHLLQQCRLPRLSHNPLPGPGSLVLTTVHKLAQMAYEQSILFTL